MRILDLLFSCTHAKTSWPQGPEKSRVKVTSCLDCGAEMFYDWQEMKIISEKQALGIRAEENFKKSCKQLKRKVSRKLRKQEIDREVKKILAGS